MERVVPTRGSCIRMGTLTTPENQAPQTFASPAEAAAFADVLRTCLADDALVTQFDRLTKSNLRLDGAPVNVAVDLAWGRIEGELRRFAAFVYDAVWLRCRREEERA